MQSYSRQLPILAVIILFLNSAPSIAVGQETPKADGTHSAAKGESLLSSVTRLRLQNYRDAQKPLPEVDLTPPPPPEESTEAPQVFPENESVSQAPPEDQQGGLVLEDLSTSLTPSVMDHDIISNALHENPATRAMNEAIYGPGQIKGAMEARQSGNFELIRDSIKPLPAVQRIVSASGQPKELVGLFLTMKNNPDRLQRFKNKIGEARFAAIALAVSDYRYAVELGSKSKEGLLSRIFYYVHVRLTDGL